MEEAISHGLLLVFGKLIGTLVNFGVVIGSAFLQLSYSTLNWVISPGFISLPYTRPGMTPPEGNPFIEVGWNLTRGLANIFFVLAFVVIGLSTALRIGGYDFKKMLPELLKKALLINFLPLLLGVIVDGTNIFMNFFLSNGLKGGNYWLRFTHIATENLKVVGLTGPWDAIENSTAALGGIALLWFCFAASIVFLVYAAVFAARHVVIWTLVILSPIAFLLDLFPLTQAYYKRWWNNFIQWSIVGMTGAFFLYLSDHMIELVANRSFIGTALQVENQPGFSQIFNLFGGYTIGLIFLYIGLIESMKTGAEGASQIMNFTDKWAKNARNWTGRTALNQSLGRLMATEKGANFARSTETLFGRMREKGGLSAVVGGAAYITGAESLLKYGSRRALRYSAQQPSEIDKYAKDYQTQYGNNIDSIAAAYASTNPADWQKRIAILSALQKTKGSKGMSKLSTEQLQDAVKKAARYDPDKLEDFAKSMPSLIEDPEVGKIIQNKLISDGLKEENGLYKDSDVRAVAKLGIYQGDELIKVAAFKKAVEGMKDSEIEFLPIQSLQPGKNGQYNKFLESLVRFKTPNFIKKVADDKGEEYIKLINQEILRLNGKQIAKTNPALLRQLLTNPAYESLFDLPTDLERITAPSTTPQNQKDKETLKRRKEAIKNWGNPAPTSTPASTPRPTGPTATGPTGGGPSQTGSTSSGPSSHP